MRLRIHLLLLPILALSGAPGFADVLLERQFLWDEANSIMTSAQTPADFRRAAETYGKLANTGVRNGPLFYNLGTAHLKAGDYAPAEAFLLRAERYMGHDPDIERNLLLAMAKGKKNAPVALPWYRFPLFWHYGIPGPIRMTMAVYAFLCCWVAFSLRTLGLPGFARRLLILALSLLVLFGSSILTSLHQESSAAITVQTKK